MTTRNFRVNNGLEVGDITISANANTITGGATAAPNADGQFANKKYVDDQLAALSQNQITEANSSVSVEDSGSNGTFVVSLDAGDIIRSTAASTTVSASAAINLTAGSDVVIPANIGLVLDGSGDEKIESDGTDILLV